MKILLGIRPGPRWVAIASLFILGANLCAHAQHDDTRTQIRQAERELMSRSITRMTSADSVRNPYTADLQNPQLFENIRQGATAGGMLLGVAAGSVAGLLAAKNYKKPPDRIECAFCLYFSKRTHVLIHAAGFNFLGSMVGSGIGAGIAAHRNATVPKIHRGSAGMAAWTTVVLFDAGVAAAAAIVEEEAVLAAMVLAPIVAGGVSANRFRKKLRRYERRWAAGELGPADLRHERSRAGDGRLPPYWLRGVADTTAANPFAPVLENSAYPQTIQKRGTLVGTLAGWGLGGLMFLDDNQGRFKDRRGNWDFSATIPASVMGVAFGTMAGVGSAIRRGDATYHGTSNIGLMAALCAGTAQYGAALASRGTGSVLPLLVGTPLSAFLGASVGKNLEMRSLRKASDTWNAYHEVSGVSPAWIPEVGVSVMSSPRLAYPDPETKSLGANGYRELRTELQPVIQLQWRF